MIQLSWTSSRTYAGVLIACGLSGSAHGDIVQDRAQYTSSILSSTFGQTFTAEGGDIASIGARLADVNPVLGVFEITISLHEGVFGTPLDSRTVTIPDGPLPYWTDFDFSGNTLTEGGLYSFAISSASGRGALGNAQHTTPSGEIIGIDYEGGDLYVDENLAPFHDLTFRVIQVPAPASVSLVLGGLVMAVRRRR